jgi:CDP-6-deoxy-D-xylo-4-hexulose-3-dehydrase
MKKLLESFRDWGRDCWCVPGVDDTCGKRFGWQLGGLPQGYDHKYTFSHAGYNLKATDMQAAVGVAQLDKLDGFIAARRRNFDALKKGLKAFEEHLILPEPAPNSEPSWFGFPLTVRPGAAFSREKLTAFLEGRRIGTRLLFAGNITRQPYFKDVPHRVVGDLTNSDRVMRDTFWIGVHPGIDAARLGYVVESFRAFFEGL